MEALEVLNFLPFEVEKKPNFRVPFSVIPSWNDCLTSTRAKYALEQFMKEWRKRGRLRAIETAQKAGLKTEPFLHYDYNKEGEVKRKEWRERLVECVFTTPVVLLVRVWRPNNIVFDVHNVCLKPVLDGFKDARLIADDSAHFIKQVIFKYEGVDKSLALTAEQVQERKEFQDARISKGRRPKRLPLPARYFLDFHKL